MDKNAGKKGAEFTDSPDPETENPLKLGNISMFLKVKGIENYKVMVNNFSILLTLLRPRKICRLPIMCHR